MDKRVAGFSLALIDSFSMTCVCVCWAVTEIHVAVHALYVQVLFVYKQTAIG